MQKKRNSIANAMELRLSCIKPSVCGEKQFQLVFICCNWHNGKRVFFY